MRLKNGTLAIAVTGVAWCAFALSASASPLTFSPIIPAFGGNPNNYSALIGVAQIENLYSSSSGGGSSPSINFPPITIDLGGTTSSGTTTPAAATAAGSPIGILSVGN